MPLAASNTNASCDFARWLSDPNFHLSTRSEFTSCVHNAIGSLSVRIMVWDQRGMRRRDQKNRFILAKPFRETSIKPDKRFMTESYCYLLGFHLKMVTTPV
ncbi:hypothetical protein KC19_8G061400 [Ceratodon purpureus]|uniref:Uncharacterized protein n=1 Tax=Ceratodon purpureus TaxID=3225 RepID=A0A8T0GVY2_CERPU|nr:hypothetical protein KC19_8G061400 [Ceratodon purpureus]